MGTTYSYVDSAPISLAPSSQAFHKRAIVTGSAAGLGTFIATTGIPSFVDPTDPSRKYLPFMVQLQAEEGTGKCYITFDGQTTPTATLGFLVPTAPSIMDVPCPAGLQADTIKVFSPTTANVQCFFKMVPVQVKP